MSPGPEPDDAPLRSWGPVPEEALSRIAVVSPHLDDAVLGCGTLLAAHPGATVVTVYTGGPDTYPDPPTRWDALAGFGPGEDVLAARRAEDERALAALGATPVWLGVAEHQYLPPEEWIGAEGVVDGLEAALRAVDPGAVVAPLGLANPDHVATHAACRAVRERLGGPVWLWYEDFGYKHIPGVLARRLAGLLDEGLWPTPACPTVSPDLAAKRAAFACYASQVRALEADWSIGAKLDAAAPEQFWSIEPPPAGWGERVAARRAG